MFITMVIKLLLIVSLAGVSAVNGVIQKQTGATKVGNQSNCALSCCCTPKRSSM